MSIPEIIWANASRLCGLPDGEAVSVRQLTSRTGVPLANLQRIQAGGNPTMETLVKLARGLRVELHILLTPPGAASQAVEDVANGYAVRSDESLLDSLAELVSRVPRECRAAFADVVSGWIASGDMASRAPALLALLRMSDKPRRAA